MNIIVQDNIFLRYQTSSNTEADIWLLHGLGESSLCFKPAFEHLNGYNVYAPDFPGFGASPTNNACRTIPTLCEILAKLIKTISGDRPIHLVGHSMSGLVCTELIRNQTLENVRSFTSIDGTLIIAPEVAERLTNLTPEDSVQKTITLFYDYALSNPTLMNYIASLKMANPEALYYFAGETYSYGGLDNAGEKYLKLPEPKLYLYGKQSWAIESATFLEQNGLQTCGVEGGHWPMMDSPKDAYGAILDFIEGAQS